MTPSELAAFYDALLVEPDDPPDFIIEVNFYCDTYGLDTISVGTSIAFVMECFQRGLLTKEHTDGMDIRFGDGRTALEVIHQMGWRVPDWFIIPVGNESEQHLIRVTVGAAGDLLEETVDEAYFVPLTGEEGW